MTQNPSLTATSKEKSIKEDTHWSSKKKKTKQKEKKKKYLFTPKNLKRKYSEIERLLLHQKASLLED